MVKQKIIVSKLGKSSFISLLIFLVGLSFGLKFVLADTECSGQNCNVNVSVIVGNSIPNVTSITSGMVITPTAKQNTSLNVSFTVTDLNTLVDLNDSTAYCTGAKGGTQYARNTSACSVVAVNSTHQNYTCSVEFAFYDRAGNDWQWSCNILDNTGALGNKNGTTFQVSSLSYVDINVSNFGWSNVVAGTSDNEATAPIKFVNGGNQIFSTASITAQNSTFQSYEISASSFKINNLTSTPAGIAMGENSSVDVSSIFDLNIGYNETEELYAYLTMPNVPPGQYTSEAPWVISISQ